MAKVFASAVLDAPIDRVWSIVRDFNGFKDWFPAVTSSEIEDGKSSDSVGCVRSFYMQDGSHVREQLTSLSDQDHSLSYQFLKPAFPVENYVAWIRLLPITSSGKTFAEWGATFDEAPEDAGKYQSIVANDVFAYGWECLNAYLQENARTA